MNKLQSVRSRLILSLLIAASATPSAAQTQRPKPNEIAAAVDSFAQRAIAAGVTPALGVAIVMDGKTILSKAYGWADASARIPADDRTLWYLASTSKSYTGFGASLLAQQHVIDFNAPITTLLPNVRWPDGVDAAHLTLANFLSHTHHINDDVVVQSAAFTGAIPEKQWPDLIQFDKPSGNNDLVYSNFGYNVAAMVIDRVRPEGWRKFLENAVYRPAGMRETYTRVSGLDQRRIAKPHDYTAAGEYKSVKFEKADATMNSAGGHLATLNDLARWVTVQMDSGRIEGKQVFPREAVELSHRLLARQTRDAARKFGPFDREGWGAGWDIGSYHGDRMVSRFGSYVTTRSHLSWLPARRIGVVAQTNGPVAGGLPDIIAAFVYDLEAGRPIARIFAEQRLDALAKTLPKMRAEMAQFDSVRASRQQPLRHPLKDFAGSYSNKMYGALTFYEEKGALRYRWGVLDGPVEVYDAKRDQMRLEVAGDGKVAAFDFDMGDAKAKSVNLGPIEFVRVPR